MVGCATAGACAVDSETRGLRQGGALAYRSRSEWQRARTRVGLRSHTRGSLHEAGRRPGARPRPRRTGSPRLRCAAVVGHPGTGTVDGHAGQQHRPGRRRQLRRLWGPRPELHHGGESRRLHLASIDIVSQDPESDSFSADVYTVDASGYPDTLHAALTPPGSFDAGALAFIAPAGTTLAANTTYSVRIKAPTSSTSVTLDTTTSDDEDDGAADGWSIGETSNFQSGITWGDNANSEAIRIAVKGSAIGNTNTAPTASDGSVTTTENTAYAFTADDFNFTDSDTDDTLEKVKIVTLPGAGTLALDSTAVTADQEVTKAAIDDGDLTFTPVTDASGSPYTTFTFKVNDGDDESASAYTMTVNVTQTGTMMPGDLLSAMLAVKDVGSDFFGCSNPVMNSNCSDTSVLTDDDFIFGGTTFTIVVIESSPGDGVFSVHFDNDGTDVLKTQLETLFIEFDGTQYRFSEASFSGDHDRFDWNSAPNWFAGESVAVRVGAVPPSTDASRQGSWRSRSQGRSRGQCAQPSGQDPHQSSNCCQ